MTGSGMLSCAVLIVIHRAERGLERRGSKQRKGSVAFSGSMSKGEKHDKKRAALRPASHPFSHPSFSFILYPSGHSPLQ